MTSVRLGLASKPEHKVAWRDIVRSALPTIRTILKIRPRPSVSASPPTNSSRATKNRESRRRRDRSRFEDRPFHEKPCNPLLRVADQIEKSDALIPRPNRRSPRPKHFPEFGLTAPECALSFRLGRWFESRLRPLAHGARDWRRAPASR